MIEITPLRETDRPAWQPLAVGYNTFYERVLPDADYDRAWRRLMKGEEMHGLAARLDGRVVGIAHYLFHTSHLARRRLLSRRPVRRRDGARAGAARALIEAVAAAARARGCPRFYWLTKQDQRPRPRALRQGRALRGLHPPRLSGGIGAARLLPATGIPRATMAPRQAVLGMEKASFYYGAGRVFEGVSFLLDDARTALVGENGAGKSTLLKCLTGELELNGGQVIRSRGLRVGSLPQDIPTGLAGQPVREVLGAARWSAPATAARTGASTCCSTRSASRRRSPTAVRHAVGRLAAADADRGGGAPGGARHPDPRRADQPSRPRQHQHAGALADGRLQGADADRQPRPRDASTA